MTSGLLRLVRNYANQPLARRSLANLLVRVLAIPVALGVSAVLARALSVEDFGVYGIVLSLFMIAAMPVVSALSNLSIREISSAIGAELPGAAVGVMLYAFGAVVVASAIYYGLMALSEVVSLPSGSADLISGLRETRWLYPAFLLAAVGGACLRGMHRVTLGTLPEQLLRQLAFLVLLLVAFLYPATGRDVAWAFGLQTLGTLGAAVFALLAVVLVARSKVGGAGPKIAWRTWNASLTPFLLLGLVQIANSQMAMVSLGVFNITTDAAYYRVSDQLSSLATLPLMAVNLAFGPMVGKLRANANPAAVQTGLNSASKLIWALSLPALALLVLLPGPLLGLLFGESYMSAAPILAILAVGVAFNAILGPVGLTLNMLGHERETLRGMRMALAVNVGLAFALVPVWGGVGAAMASTATKIVWNVVLFRYLYRLEGFSTLPFLIKPRIKGYEKA